MNTGILGSIDLATAHITENHVPAAYGKVAQLYDVQAAANGVLWLTSSGANAILRYDPATQAWSRAVLPQAASAPYGLALSPTGALWVTEGALNADRVAQYLPGQ